MGSVVERRRTTSVSPDVILGVRMYIKKCATFLDICVRLLPAACTWSYCSINYGPHSLLQQ